MLPKISSYQSQEDKTQKLAQKLAEGILKAVGVETKHQNETKLKPLPKVKHQTSSYAKKNENH